MSGSIPTIYVLYNAKASILGKLQYSYRKICAPADNSPCSACDLTHAGLKLKESEEWKATKQKISANVQQLHQDELNQELLDFIQRNGLRYPMVLGRAAVGGPLRVLLKADDLSRVSQDHSSFLSLLEERSRQEEIPLVKI